MTTDRIGGQLSFKSVRLLSSDRKYPYNWAFFAIDIKDGVIVEYVQRESYATAGTYECLVELGPTELTSTIASSCTPCLPA